MKKFWNLPRVCSLPKWDSMLLIGAAVLLILAGVLGMGV